MDATELRSIIRRGETSTVQFKEIFTNQRDFSKELVAMANSMGGIIVIGVKDDTGEIVGLEYDEIQKWSREIGNAANEQIRPTIYVQTEVVEVDGKMTLVVHVKEGANKPYKDLTGTIWIKQSADKRKVTDNSEILHLFAQNGNFRADEQAVRGTTLKDLDMYRIDEFFERVFRKPKEQFGLPLGQLMQNLQIANSDGELTLSGLLFFCKYPQQFVPAFCIKAVAFYGNSIGGTEYRDSKDIIGTIPDMYEQSLRFCEMNLHRVQAGQNFNSVGKLEVSQIALEEILQNALVHRDYIIPAAIRLLIFDDRVEIVSPGALPHGMTTDLIRMGVSCPRNPLMATFCAKTMPYRGLGSGIIRAEQDGADMDFQNIEDIQLTAILRRRETQLDTTSLPTQTPITSKLETSLEATCLKLAEELSIESKLLIISLFGNLLSSAQWQKKVQLGTAWNKLGSGWEMARNKLGTLSNRFFRQKYISALVDMQVVAKTHPDKPRHPNQQYYLTDKGKMVYKILTK